LIGESPESGLLASIFTSQRQPHAIAPNPAGILLTPPPAAACSGHRRVTGQRNLYVPIVTRAPTPDEAQQAINALMASHGGSIIATGMPTKGR
jgi:hypothetical protein